METIVIDHATAELPEIQCLANHMPTSLTRRALECWIEKHHNPSETPLVLVHYDRRDDGQPGFKIVCSEIDKTFVF